MNAVLVATLQELYSRAAPSDTVFRSQRGTAYRSYNTAFTHAVHKAGITNFTFHDLRHTFASRLVMSGIDLPTVKELLDHKAIAMTMRYAHLTTDHKQRAVTALEHFGEDSHQNSQQGQPSGVEDFIKF